MFDKITGLLDSVESLLQGEPLRAITYGALAVVWIVTHIAFALHVGVTPPPSFDTILAAITVAIAALNEAIRLYVSPASSAPAPSPVATPSVTPTPTDPTPLDGAPTP